MNSARKFDQEWPLAVGWDLHACWMDGLGTVEILRDPDGFGPCLVCGEATDWHLLNTQQRVCGMGCLEHGQAEVQAASRMVVTPSSPGPLPQPIEELRRLAKTPGGRVLAGGKPRVEKGCRACNQK